MIINDDFIKKDEMVFLMKDSLLEYLMDIITEINRLPNYLYAIDIPPYWIILGGEGCKKAEQYDRIEFERLIKNMIII